MINKGDKIALLAENNLVTTAFYDIITGRDKDFAGDYKWGVTITPADMPIDNADFFEGRNENLIDWLRDYTTKPDADEQFIRGFWEKCFFWRRGLKEMFCTLRWRENALHVLQNDASRC